MHGGRRDDVPHRHPALLPLTLDDLLDPLRCADRVEAGRALVFLLRWQTAVQLGHRPSRQELSDPVLLTAFRLSTPAEEVRGDAFLLRAAELLDRDLIEAHRGELAAQLGLRT
ncbi:MAG: hypothetical protein JWO22_3017 [Frankiales bacterium]|nr:hypothetical protein [Frankiales bacterium]